MLTAQPFTPIHTGNITVFSTWTYTRSVQIINDNPQGDAVALYSGSAGNMVSPSMNFTTCGATPFVTFKFRRNGFSNVSVQLQVSTAGPSGPWTTRATYSTSASGWYNTTPLSLAAYSGSSNVHIRLLASGTLHSGRYPIVDDVHIYCATPPSNDNCPGAISLTVSPPGECNTVTGTLNYGTQSSAGCSGTANNDVWYSFVATATTHMIEVQGNTLMDAVVQLYSGSCGSLSSLVCQDVTNTGEKETIMQTGLTIGNTYFIRVYDYFNRIPTDGTFTICVSRPPVNDECAGAISLTVGGPGICTPTNGSINAATTSPFIPSCGSPLIWGTPNNDVWYSFVATNTQQVISVFGNASMDPVIQLFSGSCGSLSTIQCMDATLYLLMAHSLSAYMNTH